MSKKRDNDVKLRISRLYRRRRLLNYSNVSLVDKIHDIFLKADPDFDGVILKWDDGEVTK